MNYTKRKIRHFLFLLADVVVAVTVSLVELLVMEEGRRKKLLMVHDSVFTVNGLWW